ncbi:MAG: DUF3253 domain-containing protein [Variovorax sp.]|nr:MAG: DUF3253 domain-containing protein [Variovorax sp.]
MCPSEVARALTAGAPGWRPLMPEVRRVAAALAAEGRLRVTRGEEEVDALQPGGPVRLRGVARRAPWTTTPARVRATGV